MRKAEEGGCVGTVEQHWCLLLSFCLHTSVKPGGLCLTDLLFCALKGSRYMEREEIRKDQEVRLLHNHRVQSVFFLATARVCSLMETPPAPFLLLA